jgi:hypothetical protein
MSPRGIYLADYTVSSKNPHQNPSPFGKIHGNPPKCTKREGRSKTQDPADGHANQAIVERVTQYLSKSPSSSSSPSLPFLELFFVFIFYSFFSYRHQYQAEG